MAERLPRRAGPRRGFTLIELLVVVLIIGILAAVAIPQYARIGEKGRAAEAYLIMNTLQASQARYYNKYNAYCTGPITACSAGAYLDVDVSATKYFGNLPNVQAGAGNPSWKIVLTRNATTALYGAYALTYDVEPNAAPALTCSNASCTNDLLPVIK